MSEHDTSKKNQPEAAMPTESQTPSATTSAEQAAEALAAPAVPKRTLLKRPKLVSDSFAMPKTEYAAFAEIKEVCLAVGMNVKKNELLRAGLAHIRSMDAAALKQALDALPLLKRRRPKSGK